MNLNLYNNNKRSGPGKSGLITTKELAKRWGKHQYTILEWRKKGIIKAANVKSPFDTMTSQYYFDLEYIKELEKDHNIGSN